MVDNTPTNYTVDLKVLLLAYAQAKNLKLVSWERLEYEGVVESQEAPYETWNVVWCFSDDHFEFVKRGVVELVKCHSCQFVIRKVDALATGLWHLVTGKGWECGLCNPHPVEIQTTPYYPGLDPGSHYSHVEAQDIPYPGR